jgi:prepilin-type N-terminal cleavage/methylation domain-containing protein
VSGRGRDQAGFTLIELLMTISIMGVITVPLGNLVIEYFQNTTQTVARVAESHDAQLAAAYFAQDVASTGHRDNSDSTNPSPPALQSVWTASTSGEPYACGSGTNLVLFVWDEFGSSTAPATVIEVAYTTQTVSGEKRLVRWSCPGPSAPQTSAVLAHDVDPGSAPSVSCSTTCTGAIPPTTVSLQLSVKDPADRGSAYQLTLRGQRRQS